MKFKEFEKWCNDRARDGCWGLKEAIICVCAVKEIRHYPLWKRENFWKENYEEDIVEYIVKPLDKKRHEVLGGK